MALYEVMAVFPDGLLGKVGKSQESLARAKATLRKRDEGYINELRPEGKVVIAARGFDLPDSIMERV